MTDYFHLFGVPRGPALDAEMLKEKFHKLTAEHHPDVAKTDADFALINEAYRTLSDPLLCLRHFIQLEFPSALRAEQNMPEDLVQLFMHIATVRRAIDAFVARETQISSPLLRAHLASERLDILDQLDSSLAFVTETHDALFADLPHVDWKKNRETVAEGFAMAHHMLSFLSKWRRQLMEDRVRLQM